MLLIMHYWVAGSLPKDEQQLMRIAAMTSVEWKKSRATLQAFFHDGWKHKRIDDELAHAEDISSKRRAAAELKHNKQHANGPANACANEEQTESKSTHTRVVSCSSSEDSLVLELKESQREQACGRKRKNKTPLPPDFVPDRDHPRKLGYSETQIDQQFEYFCDGARAHNRAYADWQAAWRNWWKSPYLTVNGDAKNGDGRLMDALKRNADLLNRGIDPLGESAVGLLPNGRSE